MLVETRALLAEMPAVNWVLPLNGADTVASTMKLNYEMNYEPWNCRSSRCCLCCIICSWWVYFNPQCFKLLEPVFSAWMASLGPWRITNAEFTWENRSVILLDRNISEFRWRLNGAYQLRIKPTTACNSTSLIPAYQHTIITTIIIF